MPIHTTTRRRFASAVGLAGLGLSGTGVAAARGKNKNFRAHLSGENEIPSVDTDARGQATFQLNNATDELSYRLIVANIEDVTQAHIHLGAADENGPVVAFLFGFVPDGVTKNGILAEGTLTDADFTGPLEGGSMADLIDVIRNDEAYVNVHTIANPPGEIRGQIH